jgi:iron complex outermembrane receptor protein
MFKTISFLGCLLVLQTQAQTVSKPDTTVLEPIELKATRAADQSPIAKTNITRAEISRNNTGQDLPFLLNQTPSVVVNSDAGTGIGYTGIRLRGSDASRINVTVNGIPYNDAESQGTFFVDLPDIIASAGSIQVQRGVGTSTNGAGSFGGSIHISTNEWEPKPYWSIQTSYGSYTSTRNSLQYNSGKFAKHWKLNLRGSYIGSNGYIDRASSRLGSVFGKLAYEHKRNLIQFNYISGSEKTYQAWYGVNDAQLATNPTYNPAGMEKPLSPYSNETDNYIQSQYQLFFTRTWSPKWKSNIALFLTRGKGYYEQYKAAESLSDYGLPDYANPLQAGDTIRETDLVRRLWLDNYFYGAVYSAQYQQGGRQVILGGSLNRYDGRHYGEIIRTINFVNVPAGYRWYNLTAAKTDWNQFVKWTEKINQWEIFADVQARVVQYSINGFRNNPTLKVNSHYFFFNPKLGVQYNHSRLRIYAFAGIANKEPNRDDFESNVQEKPSPEKLLNIEGGLEQQGTRFTWIINAFYMRYRDQLVLTGKINDVGAYTRTNIPNSYRLGLELTARWKPQRWIEAQANLTVSRNRIKDYTEYIDDYDNGSQKTNRYSETNIAYSPDVVAGGTISFLPGKYLRIDCLNKYVSRQYLDNTSNTNRSLSDFFVQDWRIRFETAKEKGTNWTLFLQVNNLFSRRYTPNGYTFSYIYGGSQYTENYYFPMAPVNWMTGVGIRF